MRFLLVVFFLLAAIASFAQGRVKIKHANTLTGSMSDGERYDRLIGDVIMVQNKTTIYCDSAHFFKKQNRVEAFGHVHITEGDSVDCTAVDLSYDGDKKIAHLRKKVVFTKLGIATLHTDFLDFDRSRNEARYFNGGKLVDTANTLTSKKGYYDLKTNLASFKKDVVGVNPDYTLQSDTLQYNSKSKIIYFKDSTTVHDKDGGVAVYQSGFYDTKRRLSNLNSGQIETPSYKMRGDKYFIDDHKKMYKAQSRVVMTSKEENMLIYGDESYYDKVRGISKVYGHAYVAKVTQDDLDTLFIRADTLVSVDNKDPSKKRLLAYHHVRIFKSDLQGVADSLAYIAPDSTIHFYKDPVLWAEENQMTADSIIIQLREKRIDKIHLIANSFVVSQDSLKNYNQIKGRSMTATFDKKAIDHVIVQGNGESIYYALEEKVKKQDTVSTKTTETMGLNKIICSNMRINFKGGKVNNISFYVMPDASFIPPHEWKDGDKKLRGFAWRGDDRPEKSDVVPQKGNSATAVDP